MRWRRRFFRRGRERGKRGRAHEHPPSHFVKGWWKREMSEFPRPLTEQEKEWLRRALALLPTGEYLGGGRWRDAQTGELQPLDPPVDPKPYLAQVDSLQVVDACRCGDPKCHYVRFQHYRPGKSYALVHTNTEDGRELIVFEDEETGLLTELEVV